MAGSSRRTRVRLPSTGSIGIPTIGARVAASEDLELDLDDGVHISVLRPADLVVFDVHATGMHVEPLRGDATGPNTPAGIEPRVIYADHLSL